MIKKHVSYQAICDGCKQKTYDTFLTYKALEKSLKKDGWKKYRKDKKMCLACPRCVGVKSKQDDWATSMAAWYQPNYSNNYFSKEVIDDINRQYNGFLDRQTQSIYNLPLYPKKTFVPDWSWP